jgi:chorismate-pyruvate lyase
MVGISNRAAAICTAVLSIADVATTASANAATPAVEWRDTPLARLEALALIETLNAEILASDSATLTLERWCSEHAIADPAQILAHRTDAAAEAPSAAIREDLQVSAQESVRYRRVELACGEHVLSVAENWYVPSRLSDAMNRLLDTTQTPFGKVVQPLQVHRQTLEAQLLWSPLPPGWERAGPGVSMNQGHLELPDALFEHRALLYTSAQTVIAEVHEIYQRDNLAFPEPQLTDAPARTH